MRLITSVGSCLLLLSGCALEPVSRQPIEQASVCCSSFAELKYSPIATGQEVRFEINSDTPAFVFRGDKSFFIAIELPPGNEKRTLLVRAFPTSVIRVSSSYFFPVVAFLDEGHREIDTIHDGDATYQPYGWSGSPSLLAIIPVPKGSKFAVVHTSSARIDSEYSTRIHSPEQTYMAGGVVFSIPEGTATMRAKLGPIGPLNLLLIEKEITLPAESGATKRRISP